MRSGSDVRWTVRINPIRCRGHGICVLLFAEGLELDRWGYGRSLEAEFEGRRQLRQANRAVRACPNGAISVEVELSEGGNLNPGWSPGHLG